MLNSPIVSAANNEAIRSPTLIPWWCRYSSCGILDFFRGFRDSYTNLFVSLIFEPLIDGSNKSLIESRVMHVIQESLTSSVLHAVASRWKGVLDTIATANSGSHGLLFSSSSLRGASGSACGPLVILKDLWNKAISSGLLFVFMSSFWRLSPNLFLFVERSNQLGNVESWTIGLKTAVSSAFSSVKRTCRLLIISHKGGIHIVLVW